MANTVAAAQRARKHGWSIIPVGLDKRPAIPSWKPYQTERPTTAELNAWTKRNPAGWAVITGKISGVVVIDFDGEPGAQTMRELGLDPHVQTGSGGYHVYITHPGRTIKTLNAKSKRELGDRYPGLDIRGDGGYAVFCGANEAGDYTWLREMEPDPPETLPQELRIFLGFEPEPLPEPAFDMPPTPIAPTVAIATLLEKYVADAGRVGRNNAGFELACQMRDNGYDRASTNIALDAFADSVTDLNTKGAREPYTRDDARRSVDQAFSQGPREPWAGGGAGTGAGPTNGSCPPCSADGLPDTEWANAELLIAQHGDNLRYDVAADKWLIWNGARWEHDDTGRIERLAMGTIRDLYNLLPNLPRNDADRLFKHIKRSETAGKLESMIKLARNLEGVPVTAAQMNANPMLLNVLNGTINLYTGALQPHQRDDLITKICPVEYRPGVDCPHWRIFVGEVFGNSEQLVAYVQRVLGYAVTGDTSEHAMFILVGKGSNGKTTLLETVSTILADYAADTPFNTFLDKRDNTTADLAALVGRRFVTASEAQHGQSFNESVLKSVTGGDPITARFLYKGYFTYKPAFKLLVRTNEIPRIKSFGYAMKRRLHIIPFNQRWWRPEDNKLPLRDKNLGVRLLDERSGILNWLIAGCLNWRREGLATPPQILRETDSVFASQDSLGEWLDTECELDPNAETPVAELWQNYLDYCERSKLKPNFRSPNWFAKNLGQRDGIDPRKGAGGLRYLSGIALIGFREKLDTPNIEHESGASGAIDTVLESFSEESVHENFSENAELRLLRHCDAEIGWDPLADIDEEDDK